MSLVYCPRTHAFFIHPTYPLSRALAAGVRVALGTDSRASNLDLDLLAEMRFVMRSHPATDPHEILRMGTLNGAEALGRAADVGSITPGKLANLVALPIAGDVIATNWADVLKAILAGNTKPSAVYLTGSRLSNV
jgi:cytosine/adenosine deaminase-related metal-dependent hydrolase